ncbi:unnamed protein product [Adineta ricciae]|uniref:Glutathione synthetase n=1 Tax=Adineta ricciae TaxID=249248 RepID=A0A816DZU9_ADIRI|nr:unnamed protein product [Adineta ricciae]CAF1644032.1 unnamed protein product [Adineta ricciae]
MSMNKNENGPMRLRWPIEDVVAFAKRYALTHGLLCLVPDNLDQATMVPFSLFPSPYSYSHFKFIWSIQTAYNRLYNRVSLDDDVLEKSLSSVIPIDDFIGRLWRIHRTVPRRQPIQLDIYRNDYMRDTKTDKMRQIEFNTISSAFAGLTGIVADIHKAVLRYTLDNCHVRELKINEENASSKSSIDLILPNNALTKSAEAMVKAFELYNNPQACILFLIVPNERNVCDQNALIDAVQKMQPNIRFYSKTFEQLNDELEYDEKTFNIYLKPSHDEVAIVYFRAGYIPDHYTNEKCWLVREYIEQSRAIKCPTARSQLAGFKIVQQYLTREGIVEKYIHDKDVAGKIRSTFASMFTFDDEQMRNQYIETLRQNLHDYVLKPNREGGGNNKYDDEILPILQNSNENELNNYIAMEKIRPPVCSTCLIKPNGKHLLHVECINEIGIYGTMVTNVETNEEYINEVTGYLVRTKTTDTNEGGVATGYSVLDCLNFNENTSELAKIFSQKV